MEKKERSAVTMEEKIAALCQTLAEVRDAGQFAALLDDLCTKKEVENMAERLYAARLLLAGRTYAQVMAETSISSATLSRVSRCVQYGQGYASVLHASSEERGG